MRARAIHNVALEQCAPEAIAAWAARKSPASYTEPLLAQTMLVAQSDDGRVIGFAQLDAAEGIVEACYVDPEFAGRGVGRALMTALEDEARGLGLARLALEATPNAVPFYTGLGYVAQGGLTQSLGSGQSLACTLMAKQLVA